MLFADSGSSFGLYFLNRFILVNDLDYAWASDPGTELFHLDSIFKINSGEAGRLLALSEWNQDTLVAFKTNRVNLYAAASQGVGTATFRNGSRNNPTVP